MAEDSNSAPVPEGFIRLVSSDGFEFLVLEEYAVRSKVIKMMLNGASVILLSFLSRARSYIERKLTCFEFSCVRRWRNLATRS